MTPPCQPPLPCSSLCKTSCNCQCCSDASTPHHPLAKLVELKTCRIAGIVRERTCSRISRVLVHSRTFSSY